MGDKASMEGAEAFKNGLPRTANPHDAGREDWMCWRDGWEQAKAVEQRPVDMSGSPAIGELVGMPE